MPRTVFMDDAAALLGVSRRTVYYRIRDGKLQTVRTFGSQRVLLASIEALLRCEQGLDAVPGVTVSDAGCTAKQPAPGLRPRAGLDVREQPA